MQNCQSLISNKDLLLATTLSDSHYDIPLLLKSSANNSLTQINQFLPFNNQKRSGSDSIEDINANHKNSSSKMLKKRSNPIKICDIGTKMVKSEELISDSYNNSINVSESKIETVIIDNDSDDEIKQKNDLSKKLTPHIMEDNPKKTKQILLNQKKVPFIIDLEDDNNTTIDVDSDCIIEGSTKIVVNKPLNNKPLYTTLEKNNNVINNNLQNLQKSQIFQPKSNNLSMPTNNLSMPITNTYNYNLYNEQLQLLIIDVVIKQALNPYGESTQNAQKLLQLYNMTTEAISNNNYYNRYFANAQLVNNIQKSLPSASLPTSRQNQPVSNEMNITLDYSKKQNQDTDEKIQSLQSSMNSWNSNSNVISDMNSDAINSEISNNCPLLSPSSLVTNQKTDDLNIEKKISTLPLLNKSSINGADKLDILQLKAMRKKKYIKKPTVANAKLIVSDHIKEASTDDNQSNSLNFPQSDKNELVLSTSCVLVSNSKENSFHKTGFQKAREYSGKDDLKKVKNKQKQIPQSVSYKKTLSISRNKNRLQVFNEQLEANKKVPNEIIAFTYSNKKDELLQCKNDIDIKVELIECFDKIKPNDTKIDPECQAFIPSLILNQPIKHRQKSNNLIWSPDMYTMEKCREYLKDIMSIFNVKTINEDKVLKLLKEQNFNHNETIKMIKKNEKTYINYLKIRKYQEIPELPLSKSPN